MWIAGTIQFAIVNIVAQLAWTRPYSLAGFNISDLGNVECQMWDVSRPRYVCSPLHSVMNSSMIAMGAGLAFGLIATKSWWGPGIASWTARILLLISAVGWVVVGFVPADVDENTHVLGALMIMGLGNIGLICASLVPGIGRLRWTTLIIGVVAVVSAWLFFSQRDPGIGLGGTERVTAFAAAVWTVIAGIAVLRRRSEQKV